MLTLAKIQIFNIFNGDFDSFTRGAKPVDKEILCDREWILIDELEQEVKLISDRLVSKAYREDVFKRLTECCDVEAKSYFNALIPYSTDFKAVSLLLKSIKSKIDLKRTVTAWAGFDSAELLMKDIECDLKQLELLDFETLEKVKLDFLPTSTYQELALTNGWISDYMMQAEEFDVMYKSIMDKIAGVG